MRAFIAIELPKEMKDYLFDLQKNFRDVAKVKWVNKKNIHLTLKFLNEVPETKIEETKKQLSKLKFNPMKVHLDKMGFFPDRSFIRVLWVGLSPAGKVVELFDDIETSLAGLFKKDDRPFLVHITLGRVKSIKDYDKFLDIINKLKVEKMEFEIKEFKLIKSTLTKDGPIYEIIGVYS